MRLNQKVQVATQSQGEITWRQGTIVGRTLSPDPDYDVMLQDGAVIANMPGELLRPMESDVQADMEMGTLSE